MQVLGINEIVPQVIGLLEATNPNLFIVSPYFKPWGRASKAIQTARAKGNRVVLLVRGGDERAKNEQATKQLAELGVQVSFLSRLHAKIYVCDTHAIVTSMNLVEASAVDSFEIGVLIEASKDQQAFKAVVEQVVALLKLAKDEATLHASSDMARALGTLTEPTPSRREPAPVSTRAARGHCIRCNNAVTFNVERPFCADCYKAWSKYSNAEYAESYCLACGKERKTSAAKPLCKTCWQAAT